MKQEIKFLPGLTQPFGATKVHGGINFSLYLKEKKDVTLVLYDRNNTEIASFLIPKEMYFGYIPSVLVKGVRADQVRYRYFEGTTPLKDPYAAVLYGTEWGKENNELFYGVLSAKEIPISRGIKLKPTSSALNYRLHVRGFTMKADIKDSLKGTFAGIKEKIPYLLKLGVSCVELMPVWEFEDYIDESRVNFWGYGDGYYFAPKAAYSESKTTLGARTELRALVDALHEAGISILLEFTFPEDTSASFVSDCLSAWRFAYGIDGFRLNTHESFVFHALKCPQLVDCDIVSYRWPMDDTLELSRQKVLQDDFMLAARRFVKGEEWVCGWLCDRLCLQPGRGELLNYLSKHDTLTLYDTVSYNRKHNEANGEENRDGTDYNCSCNYGFEGITKDPGFMQFRMRQMKNMLMLLFLAKGTPVIEAGSERLATKYGNNNSYCLDNDVNYISWEDTKEQGELEAFLCQLVTLRKSYKELFAKGRKAGGLDLPAISFHGAEAWKPIFDPMTKEFGMMLVSGTTVLFVASNMNMGAQSFGLPILPKTYHWDVICSTGNQNDVSWVEEQRILFVKEYTTVVLAAKGELYENKV